MDTKVCIKCGRELPVSQFSGNSKSHDGYQHRCKECVSKDLKAAKTGIRYSFASVKGAPDSPLAGFTPVQLMDELKARGFHGKLTYSHEITL